MQRVYKAPTGMGFRWGAVLVDKFYQLAIVTMQQTTKTQVV